MYMCVCELYTIKYTLSQALVDIKKAHLCIPYFKLFYNQRQTEISANARFLANELQLCTNNVAIYNCFGVVLTGIPLLEESPARQSIFSLRGHY